MSVFEAAIGILSPPVCVTCGSEGSALCQTCRLSEIIDYGERCFSCGKVSPGGKVCVSCRHWTPRHVWVSTTYEKTAAKLVGLFKFGHQRVASNALADLMVNTFFDFNSLNDAQRLDYIVVPIASASARTRQRGFDHTELLAKKISFRLGAAYRPSLRRVGQSRQLGLPRRIRIRHSANQYIVRNSSSISGRNLLLIDDVTTTGTTIKAATQALRQSGAGRIDCLVFAKRL